MKKWVKWLVLIVGMIGIVVALGVKDYMDQQAEVRREMIKIVESEEVQKLFDEKIKYRDSKALTEEGIIQTYEVDYDSLDLHPMGGMFVTLIINGDENLTITVDLNQRRHDSDKIEIGSTSYSKELFDLLQGEE